MGKSTISMVIFNSYVKLPEGIYISYAEHHPWTEIPFLTRTWNDRWLVWLLEWVCPILGVSLTPVFSHGFSSFRLFSSIKRLPVFFRITHGQTRSVFDTENQIQFLRYIFFRYPDQWTKSLGMSMGKWYINQGIHGAGIYTNIKGVYWWDPCYHI